MNRTHDSAALHADARETSTICRESNPSIQAPSYYDMADAAERVASAYGYSQDDRVFHLARMVAHMEAAAALDGAGMEMGRWNAHKALVLAHGSLAFICKEEDVDR